MNINKKSYFFLLLIFSIQIFAVVQWIVCGGFADTFRLPQSDLESRIIGSIRSDQGVPLLESRMSHNKLIASAFDISSAYLQFWNPVFLMGLISFAGLFGIVSGSYYFFARKKHVLGWLLFGIVILMPFVEIFSVSKQFPMHVRVAVTALPFVLWSLFGYVQILREKKLRVMWMVLILLVSSWYLLAWFNTSMGKVCIG